MSDESNLASSHWTQIGSAAARVAEIDRDKRNREADFMSGVRAELTNRGERHSFSPSDAALTEATDAYKTQVASERVPAHNIHERAYGSDVHVDRPAPKPDGSTFNAKQWCEDWGLPEGYIGDAATEADAVDAVRTFHENDDMAAAAAEAHLVNAVGHIRSSLSEQIEQHLQSWGDCGPEQVALRQQINDVAAKYINGLRAQGKPLPKTLGPVLNVARAYLQPGWLPRSDNYRVKPQARSIHHAVLGMK
jgi:hypothetical protein